jgi:hypothetical protein
MISHYHYLSKLKVAEATPSNAMLSKHPQIKQSFAINAFMYWAFGVDHLCSKCLASIAIIKSRAFQGSR